MAANPRLTKKYLRKFALGPQITYYLTPAAAIVLKWQRELEVTNGPKGDRVWLEFAFPMGGISAGER